MAGWCFQPRFEYREARCRQSVSTIDGKQSVLRNQHHFEGIFRRATHGISIGFTTSTPPSSTLFQLPSGPSAPSNTRRGQVPKPCRRNLPENLHLHPWIYHGKSKNKPQAIGGLLVCVPNTCCFLADISGREKIGLQPNHQTLQPVQAASLLDISVFEPCNLDFLVNHRRINRGIQSPNQGIHMSGEVRGGHTPAVTPMVSQTFTGTL